jgi:hypothetical protein
MVSIARRKLLAAVAGAAAWPLAARAQQAAVPVRRVGVLLSAPETDSEGQARTGALRQGLKELGWSEGRNLKIGYRWTGGNDVRARAYATELAASRRCIQRNIPIGMCKLLGSPNCRGRCTNVLAASRACLKRTLAARGRCDENTGKHARGNGGIWRGSHPEGLEVLWQLALDRARRPTISYGK